MKASDGNSTHIVFTLCLLHRALHWHCYQVWTDEAVAAQVVEEAVHAFFWGESRFDEEVQLAVDFLKVDNVGGLA